MIDSDASHRPDDYGPPCVYAIQAPIRADLVSAQLLDRRGGRSSLIFLSNFSCASRTKRSFWLADNYRVDLQMLVCDLIGQRGRQGKVLSPVRRDNRPSGSAMRRSSAFCHGRVGATRKRDEERRGAVLHKALSSAIEPSERQLFGKGPQAPQYPKGYPSAQYVRANVTISSRASAN
jgi:hypothetical protein